MSSRDDENREQHRPARWEGEAAGQARASERGPEWAGAQGASGYGAPSERRSQGRSGPGQEPSRWDPGRPDSPHRGSPPGRRSPPAAAPAAWSHQAQAPWGASDWPGSAHSAGWGSQPGGGLGSGHEFEPQSAAYGSGQWGRGPSQDWPGAHGGGSGTGYGPAGTGHGGYGQEEAWRPGPFLHDRDYYQWRAEQLRKLDEDYLAWRQERYRQFADDFNAWRASREAGRPASASAAGPVAPPAPVSPLTPLSPLAIAEDTPGPAARDDDASSPPSTQTQ